MNTQLHAAYTVALSAESIKAGKPQLILPAGHFRAVDGSGRPEGIPQGWYLDGLLAANVIALAQRDTKMVIDYEHQTLAAAKNGEPAPAAGWIDPALLMWIEGQGLVALSPKWTANARKMILADEYRYLSPVFTYDDAGNVLRLWNVALTNTPGLDLPAVALRAHSVFNPTHQSKETHVDLKKLLALLGLSETTSEADAINAVAALKASHDKQADTAKKLEADAKTLEAEIAVLKARPAASASAAPDPAKYVPIEVVTDMHKAIAALSARVSADQVQDLVDAAVADCKLIKSQVDWALDLGRKDFAALKAYIDTAPPIAALSGMQTDKTQPAAVTGASGKVSLTENQIAVCKSLGLSPEEYAKGITQEEK